MVHIFCQWLTNKIFFFPFFPFPVFFHPKPPQAGWKYCSPSAFEKDVYTSCYHRKISPSSGTLSHWYVKLSMFSKLVSAYKIIQPAFDSQKLFSNSKSLQCNRQAENYWTLLKKGAYLYTNRSIWSEMKKAYSLVQNVTMRLWNKNLFYWSYFIVTYRDHEYQISCAPSSNSHNTLWIV